MTSLRDSLVDALETVASAEALAGAGLATAPSQDLATLRTALALTAPLLRLMASALRTKSERDAITSTLTRMSTLDFDGLEKAAEDYENAKFKPKDPPP